MRTETTGLAPGLRGPVPQALDAAAAHRLGAVRARPIGAPRTAAARAMRESSPAPGDGPAATLGDGARFGPRAAVTEPGAAAERRGLTADRVRRPTDRVLGTSSD
ncbi:hypothetical protein RKD23_004365 [Streptomyces sp. SAI-170]|uniref:hypothetical protein n=1 Tax=Streptomyces sp. SAI-170 TaxID=3377729 RepID=UPI003C7D2FD2